MIDMELVKHWCALLRDERMTPDRYERRDIADTIEHLSHEVDAWRDCAKRQPNGLPNGFSRARLETCRRKYIDYAGIE